MRNDLPFHCPRTKGSALIMILIILGLAVALLVTALKSNPQIERDKITADALAKAKDALIGYAVTYRDSHPNEVFGYLPLPDLGSSRNGTPGEGNAAANFTGNTKNLTVIGRLPWLKLGIPALRDGQGECLWYAVSGSFQYASKADVLNWDSIGHFDVHSSDGSSAGTVSTTGSNYSQRPVAIIFSAGAVLSGQNRQASTTDTVTTCGGNYDARNYLDSFNADANIKNIINYFTGSANNATGYAYNLTNTSDGSQLDATALAAPKPIIFGDISTSLGKIVNDRILIITADDIFKRIKQRSDFAADIDTMIADLAACLNAMPVASLPAATGRKGIDGLLSNAAIAACLGSNTKKANIRNNWKENLLYAKLPTPTKITINGALTTNTCDAVLLFGGERTTRTVAPLIAQTRALSTEKNDPTMYLEVVNATSFPGGTAYSGTSEYATTTPSTDVLACLTGKTGPPPGSDISFSNNMASFSPAGSGGGAQVTVNPDNSAVIYITSASNKSGCFWYPTASALYNKTLRAYFKFRFRNIETNTTSSSYGDGLTFAVLPGSANVAYVDGMCGDPSQTGYSGSDNGGHAPLPLPTTNLAIEYDVYYNSEYHDPSPANKNHIAVLTGSLDHSGTTFSSPCNGTAAGCYPANTPNWLEDNVYHETRIEIFTGCNNTCSTCNASGVYALVRAWVDCTNCRDLTANFSGPPGIQSCTSASGWLNSTTNTIKFGFTSGESAGVRQTIDLSDFGVKFE